MQNGLGMLLAAISFANAYAHYNKQSIVFFVFKCLLPLHITNKLETQR
jgi:hypothetical protein